MRRILLSLLIAAGITVPFWAQSPAPGQYGTLAGGLTTASITLTAAQINAMYTSPVLLIPAQGPGTVVSIQKCVFNAIFGSAAFTGGGAIGVFYGSASPPVSYATNQSSAALLTTFSANQVSTPATAVSSISGYLNAAVYVSNVTGVFAGGTGSSMTVSCSYNVITGAQ